MKQTKCEAWFTRLSVPTLDGIERLMDEFDWQSRDTFIEDAFSVLEAATGGKPLPDCVEAARQRQAAKLLRNRGDA